MSFFNKIFGNKKPSSSETSSSANPVPGNYFFTFKDGQYTPFLLLADDPAFKTWHLSVFQSTSTPPADPAALKMFVMHAPIDSDSFKDITIFGYKDLQQNDLVGYLMYLKEVNFGEWVKATGQNMDALIQEGKAFYREGYFLSEKGQHHDAIAAYSKAIDILPFLYEALDNRAMSKMDLGDYEGAVSDLRDSLHRFSNNPVGAFALAECLLQLGQMDEARNMYQYVIQLKPDHQHALARLQSIS